MVRIDAVSADTSDAIVVAEDARSCEQPHVVAYGRQLVAWTQIGDWTPRSPDGRGSPRCDDRSAP